jgi:hypothetical protein
MQMHGIRIPQNARSFSSNSENLLSHSRGAGHPGEIMALKVQSGIEGKLNRKIIMKLSSPDPKNRKNLSGRVSLLLLWLIGIPVPILVIIFLLRGCSG